MANIHYHTFSNLTGFINYIMYPVGIFILMIGLYILVQDAKDSELAESIHHNNDNDDDCQSQVNDTNQTSLVSMQSSNLLILLVILMPYQYF